MTSRNSISRELRVRLAGARKKTIARHLRAVAPRLQLAESGDAADFVMLPSEDYERLLDEADERSAKMAFERTRDEEFVPLEIADRLLMRENPVHVWRAHRGLTLAQLGERAGLSRGYLSDIENGKRSGTVGTLRSIARALGVDVDDLVAPVQQRRTG
ncbi:MAG TPA: helix-turn-helix transcriptional regulator [Rhizomicrobium sp.]|jgi:DNA-binding XRE family transcriptional regulator|nr:helix-turn-helix transcriptional regulator [Rhizomicrobium sp.]